MTSSLNANGEPSVIMRVKEEMVFHSLMAGLCRDGTSAEF